MSAIGGGADVACQELSGPFLANRRHAAATSAKREIPSVVVGFPVEVEHVTCQVVTIVLVVSGRILPMKEDELDAGVLRRHLCEIP